MVLMVQRISVCPTDLCCAGHLAAGPRPPAAVPGSAAAAAHVGVAGGAPQRHPVLGAALGSVGGDQREKEREGMGGRGALWRRAAVEMR